MEEIGKGMNNHFPESIHIFTKTWKYAQLHSKGKCQIKLQWDSSFDDQKVVQEVLLMGAWEGKVLSHCWLQ